MNHFLSMSRFKTKALSAGPNNLRSLTARVILILFCKYRLAFSKEIGLGLNPVFFMQNSVLLTGSLGAVSCCFRGLLMIASFVEVF